MTRKAPSASRALALRSDMHQRKHPLLARQRNHHVWQSLVLLNKKHGPVTAAHLQREVGDLWHPQILADLQNAKLVIKHHKVGTRWFYVADPNGWGVIQQQVEIKIDLYEDGKGNFVTQTTLKGRKGDVGKPVRFLKSRTIRIAVPMQNEPGVQEVVGDIVVDNVSNP